MMSRRLRPVSSTFSSFARLSSTNANSPPWLSRNAVRMLSCLCTEQATRSVLRDWIPPKSLWHYLLPEHLHELHATAKGA